MATIEKTITVHTPPEHVFRFIEDPHNILEVLPSLLTVRDVERLTNGGRRFKWSYKMVGVHFEGICETQIYHFGHQAVYKTHGGLDSTITWNLQPITEGTQINLKIDYKVPLPLIGRLTEAYIIRQNDHEAECFLESLKTRIEQVEVARSQSLTTQ